MMKPTNRKPENLSVEPKVIRKRYEPKVGCIFPAAVVGVYSNGTPTATLHELCYLPF